MSSRDSNTEISAEEQILEIMYEGLEFNFGCCLIAHSAYFETCNRTYKLLQVSNQGMARAWARVRAGVRARAKD